MKTIFSISAIMVFLSIFSCKEKSTVVTPDATSSENYSAQMKKAYTDYAAANVTAVIDGNFLVVNTTTVPDHKSPYFSDNSAQFETYNGSNSAFRKAPNTITAGNITFRIPLSPTKTSTAKATPMGPIGVSLNGVPFFNQYAAGGSPLAGEINGFDQYGGHPQQQGQYHYHVEPLYLTSKKGREALLGYLLDGFPVYGPIENAKSVTTKDLDAYHGHSHVTAEYPNGIYHYHITADDPYINGSGFYGNPGTVSR